MIVFNCIMGLFPSFQSGDSQAQINGNRALEIVQINAAVFFDFLKAIGERIFMYSQPSCGLCEVEHGLAPCNNKLFE